MVPPTILQSTKLHLEVCVCVCVGLYIPAIVDRYQDFYMQMWTFVNRGRPCILEVH